MSRNGAQGSGGRDDKGESSQQRDANGIEGSKRKWSDLEDSMKAMSDTMKAMKDAVAEENAEKSKRICRLRLDNVLLEKTLLHAENSAFQAQMRPMSRPEPLVLFPAEVWEMIIQKMTLSSDLEMLCLAYPQLEPLVKKTKKTVFMFEDVAPFVFKYLSLNDMDTCRLVCGKWNQDVHTLLANWNAPNLLPEASSNDEVSRITTVPDGDPPLKLKRAYTFQNHRKIQKFMVEMAEHPGNPFVGRILRLSVDSQTELKYFWNLVLELVGKFGKHVWNLEIKCLRAGHKQTTFYNALQQTLLNLPNLKYLTIDCDFNANGPSHKNMALQILGSPLPPLPYLQSLKLALNRETGMISAFMPLFSQPIRRLKLRNGTFGNVNLKDQCLLGFVNLKHLEVDLKSKEDILRLLKIFSPNLKELCLHSDRFPGPMISFTSEQVGSLLEKFYWLEHLDLTYCRIEREFAFDSTVRLSRLKILEIAVGADEDDLQHNLDFLLWLPSLKHLVIDKLYTPVVHRSIMDERDKNSTLKIRNYLQTVQILDSNVWTLIPSLELLELETIIGVEKYTREMFVNRVG